MPIISDTLLNVPLVGGNRAVYIVPPERMAPEWTLAALADVRALCQQFAHQHNGTWYEPGGSLRHAWHESTDPRTLALLERAQEVG